MSILAESPPSRRPPGTAQTAIDAAGTVRSVRAALERARASRFLSDLDASTRWLQQACAQLHSLLPPHWRKGLTDGEQAKVRAELLLLAGEIARSEALHDQARGLMAGWAQIFAEAAGIQPAEGYGRNGEGGFLVAQSLGSHEWEA